MELIFFFLYEVYIEILEILLKSNKLIILKINFFKILHYLIQFIF